MEWDGRQLQTTPREIFEAQVAAPMVVVDADSETGTYVTAVRVGDRICVGLNEVGKDGPEDWCAMRAVALPDQVAPVGLVHTKQIATSDGSAVTIAYGVGRSNVDHVVLDDGHHVATSRRLAYWQYVFFQVVVPDGHATIRLLDASGSTIGHVSAG